MRDPILTFPVKYLHISLLQDINIYSSFSPLIKYLTLQRDSGERLEATIAVISAILLLL